MLMVAIGWQLYALTGSALDLGLLGLAQFVPMLVLTLLVGHVADRYDHRLILLVCQLGEAMRRRSSRSAPRWAGSTAGDLRRSSRWSAPARAFEIPTMVAIIPALVPRPLVPAATAWFASANQAGQIVGPVLGGLLYGLGPAAVYGTAIALWCIGAASSAMIEMERVPRASRADEPALADGRLPLRLRDRVDPRHHLARHVRGVPRAAPGAVSDLRPRHPARPGRGASACCAPRPAVGALRCRWCWRAGR